MKKKPELGEPDYTRRLNSNDEDREILVEIWSPRAVEVIREPLFENQKSEKITLFKTLFSISDGNESLYWEDVQSSDKILSLILAFESINIQMCHTFKGLTWMGGDHGFPFIDPRKCSE